MRNCWIKIQEKMKIWESEAGIQDQLLLTTGRLKTGNTWSEDEQHLTGPGRPQGQEVGARAQQDKTS